MENFAQISIKHHEQRKNIARAIIRNYYLPVTFLEKKSFVYCGSLRSGKDVYDGDIRKWTKHIDVPLGERNYIIFVVLRPPNMPGTRSVGIIIRGSLGSIQVIGEKINVSRFSPLYPEESNPRDLTPAMIAENEREVTGIIDEFCERGRREFVTRWNPFASYQLSSFYQYYIQQQNETRINLECRRNEVEMLEKENSRIATNAEISRMGAMIANERDGLIKILNARKLTYSNLLFQRSLLSRELPKQP